MTTRSKNTGTLYTKDDHDLIYRKTRADKGKKKGTRRFSMATSRSEDLESIRYSEQDPTTGGPETIRPGTLEKIKGMFQLSPKDKDGKPRETGTNTKPKVRQEQVEQDPERYDTETVITGITGTQVEIPRDLLQVDPECPPGEDDGDSQDADDESDDGEIQEVYSNITGERRQAGTDAATGRELYPEVVPRRQYRDAGTGTRDRSAERPAREPIRNLLSGNQATGTVHVAAGGGRGQPPNPPNPNAYSGYYGPTRTQDAFNAFHANIGRRNVSTPENSLYEDEATGNQGKGIATLLSHIVKPVKTLISKTDREDDYLLERADRHLRKVTTNAVQDAMDYDLRDLLALVQHLNASVQRLEKNERVSSTALCSKVNALKVNKMYPTKNSTAKDYASALISMTQRLKEVRDAKNMTLEKNSYDYVYEAALIASSVVANYMLSMDQHFHLIVGRLPSSAEKNLISKCTSLENLLDVISTLAPCLKTRSQIEEQIKQWSLVTLSTESITRSVGKLTDLIEAIHSDSPLPYPELFRTIISRILLEKLPERVNKELVETRHKITNEDNLNTLLQLLLSVLYSLVGYKPKQSTNQGTGFPQVKAIQDQPEKTDFVTLVLYLVAAVQAASAQSVVPPRSRNPNAGVPKQQKNDGGGQC
jgi:hypothetical protein